MPIRDGVVQRGRTWSYVVRVRDPETGRSKPRWVGGFPTEDAAKEARDEARVAARRGEFVERSTLTVAAYLNEWLEGHAMEVKPRTLAGYRDIVNRYVIPHIGSMRVQAVRPATLSALYRQLLERGGAKGGPLSARTVNLVHATLRKAFNDAVRMEGLLPSNPAERAKRPRRMTPTAGDVWDAEQLQLFLTLAQEHPWFALYRLASYSGARRGELLAARWTDIDWTRRTLRIRASAGMVENRRVEGSTKSGHERTVSLDAETLAILRRHRRQQMANQAVAAEAWVDHGLLFVNGLGQPIYPTAPYARMQAIIRDYNAANRTRSPTERGPELRRIRFHDLRHVHATLLLKAGVPVHVVAARLGHADPSITLRVYAHVIPDQAAEVAETFAAIATASTTHTRRPER